MVQRAVNAAEEAAPVLLPGCIVESGASRVETPVRTGAVLASNWK
jgi:hypothetical protein